jgi:hypothetical protein
VVRRVDEVRAARQPVLRYTKEVFAAFYAEPGHHTV